MSIDAILVDSRESHQIQRLKFGGVPVAVMELEAGDFQVACSDGTLLAIERKTPIDLLNTLRANRLFPQIAKLRALTPWAYLLITGGLYPSANDAVHLDEGGGIGSRETGWSWASVQGALLTCQESGAHIVFCNGLLDIEPTIIRLAKRDHSALKVQPARDVELLSEYEQVISALPAIGPERARALLQHCGTPARVLQFLTDDRASGAVKVPGVGSGLKRITRDTLGLDEWQELTVLARDVLPGQAGAQPQQIDTVAVEAAATPELVRAAA